MRGLLPGLQKPKGLQEETCEVVSYAVISVADMHNAEVEIVGSGCEE